MDKFQTKNSFSTCYIHAFVSLSTRLLHWILNRFMPNVERVIEQQSNVYYRWILQRHIVFLIFRWINFIFLTPVSSSIFHFFLPSSRRIIFTKVIHLLFDICINERKQKTFFSSPVDIIILDLIESFFLISFDELMAWSVGAVLVCIV